METNASRRAFARRVLAAHPRCRPDTKGVAMRRHSGSNLARCRSRSSWPPQAIEGLKALRADFQSSVRDAIELHLRHEPTKLSKSRIKRKRGLDRPQYRLKVNEVRVFYDVTATAEGFFPIFS